MRDLPPPPPKKTGPKHLRGLPPAPKGEKLKALHAESTARGAKLKALVERESGGGEKTTAEKLREAEQKDASHPDTIRLRAKLMHEKADRRSNPEASDNYRREALRLEKLADEREAQSKDAPGGSDPERSKRAKEASEHASQMSQKVFENDTAEGFAKAYKAAAEAHRVAEDASREAGDEAQAEKHRANAERHEKTQKDYERDAAGKGAKLKSLVDMESRRTMLNLAEKKPLEERRAGESALEHKVRVGKASAEEKQQNEQRRAQDAAGNVVVPGTGPSAAQRRKMEAFRRSGQKTSFEKEMATVHPALSDPQRIAAAKKQAMTPRSVQRGARGGVFFITRGGAKVYVKQ